MPPENDHEVLSGVLTVCLISLDSQGLGDFHLMKGWEGCLGPCSSPWWQKMQQGGLLAKAGKTSVGALCLVGIPGAKQAFKIPWVRTL